MTGPGKAGPSAFDLIWAPQERGSSRHQGHGGDSSDLAPVHHQLPEFTQTHVHRVGDAIRPSHPLLSPSPPAPNPSHGLFLWLWRAGATL